jgi:hypothetical protein
MIASTNPVRKLLLAASLGAAPVGFASVASALPVYSAWTLVKAAPPAVEDVEWRGRRAGWRRWDWRARWFGGHRPYPIGRYYIGPAYYIGPTYDSCHSGGSWPDRLGCW